MPTWLVALIVGLGSGLAGTFIRVAHERGAELRTRMLEAADDFVTTMTITKSDIGLAVFPTVTAASARREGAVDPARQEAGEGAFRIANAHWTEADGHVPRITLLFGVGSDAAKTARQASDTLGRSLVQLARVNATAGYEGDDVGGLDTSSSVVASRRTGLLRSLTNSAARLARQLRVGTPAGAAASALVAP